MKHKRILTAVVTTALLLGLAMPVLAAVVTKTITVETDVKVYVNDKALDAGDTHGNPDCFIYNGTTYVAVAAVSKSLGQDVKWEGQTRSVYIGRHGNDGISQEFLETMDAYEAFFDEYCAFMKKYKESDNTLAMLSEYAEFMNKYTEMMKELYDFGDREMSVEETGYYVEVLGRITQKVAKAVQ